jgi:hypothetical protein
MNDFTKEELEELVMWSKHLAGYNPALLNKIQSLIDNYCDHEDGGEIEIFVDVCRKCNAYLLRERHFDPE